MTRTNDRLWCTLDEGQRNSLKESPMDEERERFYSRLATIQGIRPMPSIGQWILLKVENPGEMARRINRRLAPGVVTVPRNVPNAIRIPVRDPKANEELFFALRELAKKYARQRFYQELRRESIES
jgi:histidinol-phosphate/aromatic aminotransferase/cobyric acid decarboxylase-like protein